MPNYFESTNASGSSVALAHTIWGDPVEDTKRPNAAGDNIKLAVGSVFQDYEDPNKMRNGKPVCRYEECRAYPSKDGYCIGHARKLGLVENWNKDGRKHEPE